MRLKITRITFSINFTVIAERYFQENLIYTSRYIIRNQFC